MRFKCNTTGCEHIFETKYTEEDINKKDLPICPKCKNKDNKSYRYEK